MVECLLNDIYLNEVNRNMREIAVNNNPTSEIAGQKRRDQKETEKRKDTTPGRKKIKKKK